MFQACRISRNDEYATTVPVYDQIVSPENLSHLSFITISPFAFYVMQIMVGLR